MFESAGTDLVSPGLPFVSEVPASDGLWVCTTGGCVTDVGVGGICCGCVGAFTAEVVALRLLFE